MVSPYIDQLLGIARQISWGEVPAYQHNECFTAGEFDLLIVHAKGAEAFALLSELCARFPAERSVAGDLRGYYQLLTQVARQTETTGMPEGMSEILAAAPELSGELRDWYRQS